MLGWVVFFAGALFGGLAVWFRGRGQRTRALAAAGLFAATWVAGFVLLWSVLEMQKVAAYLVMPLSVMWLGLGAVTIDCFARRKITSGTIALAAFLVYSIGGNSCFATRMHTILEDRLPPHVPIAQQPVFDAVFVLGGGAILRPDNREPQLTEWGDRVFVAGELYVAGKTKVLVASGGASMDQVEASAHVWRLLGVPAEAIRALPDGRNTSEEMATYKELIDREGWTKTALVSSAYHLPRAMENAKRLGLAITPIATHRKWPAPYAYDPLFLIPRPEVWARTQQVLWELGGMAVGR